MNIRWKQFVAILILVGQIFVVKTLNRNDKPTKDLEEEESLKKFGFHLRESAKECGIDFVHDRRELFVDRSGGAVEIFHRAADVGLGVADQVARLGEGFLAGVGRAAKFFQRRIQPRDRLRFDVGHDVLQPHHPWSATYT